MVWTHAGVRSLLRALRHPQSLEKNETAAIIKGVYPAATAAAALTLLVRDALKDYDQLLVMIVERCDVAGHATKVVADDLHLSRRQFFRYRARAIDAIATKLDSVLREHRSPGDVKAALAQTLVYFDPRVTLELYRDAPFEPTDETAYSFLAARFFSGERLSRLDAQRLSEPWRARALVLVAESAESSGDLDEAQTLVTELEKRPVLRDDAAAFDLARLQCERARRASDAGLYREWSRTARERAHNDPRRATIAELLAAEATMRGWTGGSVDEHLARVQRLLPAAPHLDLARHATLVRAEWALHEGDAALAHELARAALAAGFNARTMLRAHALEGRSTLALGRRWRPAETHVSTFAAGWYHASIVAIGARHALADGDVETARKWSLAAQRDARRLSAPSVSAYAHATLGALAAYERDPQEAQRQFVEAWKLLALHADRLAAHDVFTIEGVPERDVGPLVLDELFAATLSEVASRDAEADAAPHESGFWRRALVERSMPLEDVPERILRAVTTVRPGFFASVAGSHGRTVA